MFPIELRKSCHDRPNGPSHFVGLSRIMEGARDGAGSATGRWQDKRPHGELRSGGCFYWVFWRIPHCAACRRNVRKQLLH
jgi:hypothetical protein